MQVVENTQKAIPGTRHQLIPIYKNNAAVGHARTITTSPRSPACCQHFCKRTQRPLRRSPRTWAACADKTDAPDISRALDESADDVSGGGGPEGTRMGIAGPTGNSIAGSIGSTSSRFTEVARPIALRCCAQAEGKCEDLGGNMYREDHLEGQELQP